MIQLLYSQKVRSGIIRTNAKKHDVCVSCSRLWKSPEKAKAKTSVILVHSLEGFHLQSHGSVLLGWQTSGITGGCRWICSFHGSEDVEWDYEAWTRTQPPEALAQSSASSSQAASYSPTFFTQSIKLWNQQLIRPESNCFAMAPPLHIAHCTGECVSHTWVFEDVIYLTETNIIYIVYVFVYFNRLFSLFFKKINLNKPVLSIHSALMATWHHKNHLSCSERKSPSKWHFTELVVSVKMTTQGHWRGSRNK